MSLVFLRMVLALVSIAWCMTSCTTETDNAQMQTQQKYQQVWEDEFDDEGLPDTTQWSYDVGGWGWGNNEWQYYTEARGQNARIEDGKLIIEAHKEEFEENTYTSARLVTQHKGDWQYGKFLIKAKLPAGRGTWPAIWMLSTLDGKRQWPLDGEIDIMEHVGYDEGTIHGTIHTQAFNHMKGTQKSGQVVVPHATTAFHEYGLEWTPSELIWTLDGEPYYTLPNTFSSKEEWPFDAYKFHLILNVAVGGNWGGREGVDETIWPQRMEVDYVRVYQKM